MNYKIQSLDFFEKQASRLIKKYPSLKKELFELAQQLKANPKLGVSIGQNCFKIRLAISSKSKGKSGGARVITYLKIVAETIYFLSIYDKSEQPDITAKDLSKLIKKIID